MPKPGPVDGPAKPKKLAKALVECLFERGLLKMIFATETLAAGIHMPARSVLITQLEKKAGDC